MPVAKTLVVALAVVHCSMALAQTETATPAAAARVETTALPDVRSRLAKFFDPKDGQLDLSALLEDPRGFLPVPLIVTEPAVGYGGGMVGMFLRPRKDAGDEGWARPDISAIGGFGTQNGTWGALAGDSSLWLDGRLKTLVGGGTGRVNLDFFGLGTDASSLNEGVRYSLQFSGAVAQANWKLAPKSPWAVGVRYVYADVDPTLRDQPLFPNLANAIRTKISAPTAILEYDSRDNVFTPTRGIFSESSYMNSRTELGATDDFNRFEQVLMGWWPARDDVTLGVRGDYARSSGGTPFFLRPYIQLRGVPVMRYQGDQMASAEFEARWQFYGRWSAVAFGGVGTTRSDRDGFSATQNVGSGGLGFRYLLASKFGLHAGIDVAHSPGTTAFYIQVGNAWFRP
jgi:hypothetical protein